MEESNLPIIVPAIVATLEGVTELTAVLPYMPDNPPGTPFLIFDYSTYDDLREAQGEAAYDWVFSGYVCLHPTNPKEAAKQWLVVLPKILAAMGRNISASGTIAHGEVMVKAGRPRGMVPVGGTEFPARELVFRIRERFAFVWALLPTDV